VMRCINWVKLRTCFEAGFVSREIINSILTAYNGSCSEMQSESRDVCICRYPNAQHTVSSYQCGHWSHWVQKMAFCQYGHDRIKDRTCTGHHKMTGTRTSLPIPAQCCAFGYLHIRYETKI
jgi:hypothetical protein